MAARKEYLEMIPAGKSSCPDVLKERIIAEIFRSALKIEVSK